MNSHTMDAAVCT